MTFDTSEIWATLTEHPSKIFGPADPILFLSQIGCNYCNNMISLSLLALVS